MQEEGLPEGGTLEDLGTEELATMLLARLEGGDGLGEEVRLALLYHLSKNVQEDSGTNLPDVRSILGEVVDLSTKKEDLAMKLKKSFPAKDIDVGLVEKLERDIAKVLEIVERLSALREDPSLEGMVSSLMERLSSSVDRLRRGPHLNRGETVARKDNFIRFFDAYRDVLQILFEFIPERYPNICSRLNIKGALDYYEFILEHFENLLLSLDVVYRHFKLFETNHSQIRRLMGVNPVLSGVSMGQLSHLKMVEDIGMLQNGDIVDVYHGLFIDKDSLERMGRVRCIGDTLGCNFLREF